MINYLKAVATKAFGVFLTTFLGAVGAENLLGVGVQNLGDALEVSASAVVVTVLWPAASKIAARAQATKIPDINGPPGSGPRLGV